MNINDGIDCESIVNISGGSINIETNGTPIETTQVTAETTQETPHRGMWEMDEADVEFEKSTKAKKEQIEPELLPHFSVHNLRHTFCTRFCENETNLKII